MTVKVYREKRYPRFPSLWIQEIAEDVAGGEEYLPPGQVSIILVGDARIRELNERFLHRDRPTDVIVFPLGEEDVWGEIYISVDRAQEQAGEYGTCKKEEMARLVIHGMLHLAGFGDSTAAQSQKMRKKEDFYLGRHTPESKGVTNQ